MTLYIIFSNFIILLLFGEQPLSEVEVYKKYFKRHLFKELKDEHIKSIRTQLNI